jgi:hypothetical protein
MKTYWIDGGIIPALLTLVLCGPHSPSLYYGEELNLYMYKQKTNSTVVESAALLLY